MDDALLVRGFERIANALRNIQGLPKRKRPTLQAVRQGLAFDQFQHQVA